MHATKYQIITFDGSEMGHLVSLFQAVGRTSCGRELFFHRKLHGWTVSEIASNRLPSGKSDDNFLMHTDDYSFGQDITLPVIRHVAGPLIEFTPDALLPMALNDPDEVAALLAAGANPNRVPETVYNSVAYTVMGRLPMVLIDELIHNAAAALQNVLPDCVEAPSSPVESLVRLTGIPSSTPHRFKPTDLRSKFSRQIEKIERMWRVRELLVEAGAVEVQDFFRAVRSYCFDEAEKFLSDGLSVDALQAAGCSMLTERILARDDAAVEWLLDHGANPNLSPSPSNSAFEHHAIDVIAPVKEVYSWDNPRILREPDLLESISDIKRSEMSKVLWDSSDGKVNPSPFHPLVASLLADNQPAFDMLLARGADIHAVCVFHRCIPPDWAFKRLAALEIDWQQPLGRKQYSAVMLWSLQPDSPVKSRGLELWEEFASPADRIHLKDSWALLKRSLPDDK